MKELLGIFGFCIGIPMMFLGIVVLICWLVSAPYFALECHTKGRGFEDTDYELIGGCMVKHEGMWVSLDSVKFIKVSGDNYETN